MEPSMPCRSVEISTWYWFLSFQSIRVHLFLFFFQTVSPFFICASSGFAISRVGQRNKIGHLFVVKSDSCWFLCWEPEEHKQAFKKCVFLCPRTVNPTFICDLIDFECVYVVYLLSKYFLIRPNELASKCLWSVVNIWNMITLLRYCYSLFWSGCVCCWLCCVQICEPDLSSDLMAWVSRWCDPLRLTGHQRPRINEYERWQSTLCRIYFLLYPPFFHMASPFSFYKLAN